MSEVWFPLSTVAAAVIAGVVSWAVARRTASGRIDTSDATDLWGESKTIRKELREEIASLKASLATAEQQLSELRDRLSSSQDQARELKYEVIELRRLCGHTNIDVQAIRSEMATAISETKGAVERRNKAEGGQR